MDTVKKSKIFIVIFVVLIAILAIFLAYKKFYSKTPKIPKQQPTASSSMETVRKASVAQGIDYYKGFALYQSAEFGFEIKYPDNWQVAVESMVNVRGEQTKGFFFKKPNSGLRFAILPRDGLSYGLETNGTSTPVYIGGSPGIQTQYTLKDGRRLWLLYPQYGLHDWSEDIGRIDILSSAEDPAGDTIVFEKMLNSFKLLR